MDGWQEWLNIFYRHEKSPGAVTSNPDEAKVDNISTLVISKKESPLKGGVFGCLTVTGRVFRGEISGCTRSVTECMCACGKTILVRPERLKSGRTISCGCTSRRKKSNVIKKKRYIPIPADKRKKPGRKKKIYDRYSYETYKSMHRRCRDHKHPSFEIYGGRGISVCDEWSTFDNFLKDMGQRPLGKELDRIDCDKGYSKENCRWATHKENMQNTRRAIAKKIALLSGQG